MEHATITQLLIIFFAAIPIGIYAILFGGSLFLSMPVFQILFPQALVGSIIGNIKVGSVFRNGIALYSGKETSISLLNTLKTALPYIIGTIIGSWGIISLPQIFMIPILIGAIIITEISTTIIKLIPNYLYIAIALLTGIYIGIFGAGSLISILALLHIKNPQNKNIAKTRLEALFIEFILAIISITIFFIGGKLNLMVAFAWTSGSLIGGYFGGKLITRSGKLSPKTQKNFLRATFVIALIIAVWTVFNR